MVYTPLHGSGNQPVRRVLAELGYQDVIVVPEQELPDGDFTTAPYPNPEDRSVFNLAMALADQCGADIIIGTDPDCDRVGVVGRNQTGEFEVFTGNQTGALLVDYYLKTRTELPDNKVVIKTIVTSELGGLVAKSHGAAVLDVLTGFKYIGECMTEFEQSGDYSFAFGYEESYGYLAGTHARDKDAVVTALLICEMADYFKKQGKTLIDVLAELSKEYGYCLDKLSSYTLAGKKGLAKIADIMAALRVKDVQEILPDIGEIRDYAKGIDGLPAENVLKFILKDHSWIAVRPSGTEPKIKVYCSLKGKDEEETSRRFLMYKEIWEREFDL